MPTRLWLLIALSVLVARASSAPAGGQTLPASTAPEQPGLIDPARHLPLQKVRPGQIGYGLTALPGEPAAKFKVEVVSILQNFTGPKQDVILARCSGADLEHTGILAGMSGSPVYLPDPDDDGKMKLAGAIAYGWAFNKEPICGIQPIEQMLLARSLLRSGSAAASPRGSAGRLAGAPLQKITSGWRGTAAGLDPLLRFGSGRPNRASADPSGLEASDGGLQPLMLPLGVCGGTQPLMEHLRDLFAGTHVMPVAAASASAGASSQTGKAGQPSLRPGDPVAILLLWGDLDISAAGTVTDVVGREVFAFGHSFDAGGSVRLPMAAAEVQGRVASLYRSFKITSAGEVLGTFLADQYTAMAGRLGEPPPAISVQVTVAWPEARRCYRYNIVEHPTMTPIMAGIALEASLLAYRNLPDRNTVRYTLDVDLGKAGRYRVQNLVSDTAGFASTMTVVGDLAAPLASLATGPYGPVFPEAIRAEVAIEPKLRLARILDAELLTPKVRPGQALRLRVRFQTYEGQTSAQVYELTVPANAAVGRYRVIACSWRQHLQRLRMEQPDRFDPRSLSDVVDLLNLVGSIREDRLYLRLLPQKPTGLSISGRGLPDLPPFWQEVLTDSSGLAAKPRYVEALVKQVPLDFVLVGSAEFPLTVQKAAPAGRTLP